MTGLTQMMKHWLSVKDKYKDCIIFYRLGDFYEMFFDDAIKASEMLDLTLTGRDCGLEKRAPMCGVPHHAAEEYIIKLVELGEKVAICEQVEDPATAKGMVAREVVRVVTAGTLDFDKGVNEEQNNYVCCMYKDGDVCAIAWADITTGELTACEFFGEECVKQALTHMLKLSVKEIICNDAALLETKNAPEIKQGVLPHPSNFPAYAFAYDTAERRLLAQFGISTLEAYPIYGRNNAISAAGALVEYLKETQMHALQNINGVKLLFNTDFMQLDTAAMRNLEITKNSTIGKKHGSLLWVIDKTKTGMGKRRLFGEIACPMVKKKDIDYRLSGVEELYDTTVIRLALSDALKQIKDIERISGKISNNKIKPQDCLNLSRSLALIPSIKMQLLGFSSSIIGDIYNNLGDFSDVCELLDQAIFDPVADKKQGEPVYDYLKCGFNKELDDYRDNKNNGTDKIAQLEAREREETGIKSLKIKYNRIFGYYIEVTKSFVDKVPFTYQRKQTLANAERYTTEELKLLEEKILSSSDMADKLELELYGQIKLSLAKQIDRFKRTASALADLDILVSFAEIAKNNRYVKPEIVESDKPLIITEGRHPVVEAISSEKFIANDLLLDEGENSTILLTGPNMAGKSTYMRQAAIITIMAQLGSFVPAKKAQIPIVDRIFTRVGASDNLISDQSTFMVEMIEVASIMRNATKHSLLILDEVGRGTSTFDGLSIAWAVVEHITKHIGAKTLFATHYQELTALEGQLNGLKNYKISVRELNGSIVFLRKILRGSANRSYGIEVAALAGIPDSVINRAKTILKRVEKGDKNFSKPQSTAEEERVPTEIERILLETDVNNMSPMQAFLVLGDLVEKVKM